MKTQGFASGQPGRNPGWTISARANQTAGPAARASHSFQSSSLPGTVLPSKEAESLDMVAQVSGHEAGDEIVAVVVTRTHVQGQRLAGFLAGFAQQMRLELFLQKWVGFALFHQQFRRF